MHKNKSQHVSVTKGVRAQFCYNHVCADVCVCVSVSNVSEEDSKENLWFSSIRLGVNFYKRKLDVHTIIYNYEQQST